MMTSWKPPTVSLPLTGSMAAVPPGSLASIAAVAHFDPQRPQGTHLGRPIDEALGIHQHHLGDGLEVGTIGLKKKTSIEALEDFGGFDIL